MTGGPGVFIDPPEQHRCDPGRVAPDRARELGTAFPDVQPGQHWRCDVCRRVWRFTDAWALVVEANPMTTIIGPLDAEQWAALTERLHRDPTPKPRLAELLGAATNPEKSP